ncbi:unnamed protein product [Albugo candida]|uniref:Uncharacterized protein n=1 Tax=Albugo candida TaxID=65357 RepID=A0A024G2C2_9STRA|nr:unnamed protein product [Albugo candida]|eukprot:CCI40998.1 unnamed protein product [Albugo candida]
MGYAINELIRHLKQELPEFCLGGCRLIFATNFHLSWINILNLIPQFFFIFCHGKLLDLIFESRPHMFDWVQAWGIWWPIQLFNASFIPPFLEGIASMNWSTIFPLTLDHRA